MSWKYLIIVKFEKPNWKARGGVKLRREKKMDFRPNAVWFLGSIGMFTSRVFNILLPFFPSCSLKSVWFSQVQVAGFGLSCLDCWPWGICSEASSVTFTVPHSSSLSAGLTLGTRSLIATPLYLHGIFDVETITYAIFFFFFFWFEFWLEACVCVNTLSSKSSATNRPER